MPTGIYTGPLCVLDLTSLNWYVPAISGDVPKFRAYHKANLIGKYMVISFGKYILSHWQGWQWSSMEL